jgi:hypothetical protein
MKRRVASLAFLTAFLASGVGFAEEGAPSEASPPGLAIAANPLALLVGRYSAQAEVRPSERLGIVVNPYAADHAQTFQGNGVDYDSSQVVTLGVTGFGAEAGPRFYSSGAAVSGFLGPSLLVGRFVFTRSDQGVPQTPQHFWRGGIAIDGGLRVDTTIGFLFEVGGGLEYTIGSPDMSCPMPAQSSLCVTDEELAYGSGLRPRILLSVGWGFLRR